MILKKIKKALSLLFELGPFGIIQISRIYLIDAVVAQLCIFLSKSIKKIIMHKRGFWLAYELKNWSAKKDKIIANGWNGKLFGLDEFGLEADTIATIYEELKNKKEVVVANIDQDGYLMGLRGSMSKVSQVSQNEFMKRKRFELSIVALNGGRLGVRKNYRGDKRAFLNELKSLHILSDKRLNVPGILSIDFDSPSLIISYIPGETVRERLAKAGVKLLDRDVESDANLKKMSPADRRLLFIKKAKEHLYSVIDHKYVDLMFELIKKIHSFGIVINDIKYGNMMIHRVTGQPWLIDFDGSPSFNKLPKSLFRVLRDNDIEQFNLHFGTEKLSRMVIKRKIATMTASAKSELYAPVYFGDGIKVGRLWSIDSGFGRWHYILKHNLSSFAGKRILDLGANNGSVSLEMLRAGARESVAVELNNKAIEQGKFLKDAFEWHDNKQYNFKYVRANMRDIIGIDLGRFDIVMALCSIYYLNDYEISRVIKHISTISNVLVLQCNLARDIERADEYTYKKASVEYTVGLLRNNGFPVIRVVAPKYYDRPLVIGEKNHI